MSYMYISTYSFEECMYFYSNIQHVSYLVHILTHTCTLLEIISVQPMYNNIMHYNYSQVSISVTTSFSYETGGSATETSTDTTQVMIEVPPRSQIQAIIRSNRYTVDVPYTATVTPEFTDGANGTPYSFSGVYSGGGCRSTTCRWCMELMSLSLAW